MQSHLLQRLLLLLTLLLQLLLLLFQFLQLLPHSFTGNGNHDDTVGTCWGNSHTALTYRYWSKVGDTY